MTTLTMRTHSPVFIRDDVKKHARR
jgi:hypothetical protein